MTQRVLNFPDDSEIVLHQPYGEVELHIGEKVFFVTRPGRWVIVDIQHQLIETSDDPAKQVSVTIILEEENPNA